MTTSHNSWVLITGASSGFGQPAIGAYAELDGQQETQRTSITIN
jgi:NADP-dependent 3-hydroxy acid dehydrogenase YdfG